jgi:NADH-quinone oxidoreductase subunit M
LISATVYSLRIVQKVFYGTGKSENKLKDLSVRESFIMGIMVVAILWLGLFPQPVIDTAKPALLKTIESNEHHAVDLPSAVTEKPYFVVKIEEISKLMGRKPEVGSRKLSDIKDFGLRSLDF